MTVVQLVNCDLSIIVGVAGSVLLIHTGFKIHIVIIDVITTGAHMYRLRSDNDAAFFNRYRHVIADNVNLI